jgi:mannose-1-phosphate guanylyltransferase
MKAALLAAGLGTRLRPLTHQCPKALIPVLNRPLLGVLLDQLQAAGCGEVAVNTHHLAAAVHRFLEGNDPFGFALKVSHEPELLGTGGGLRDLGKLLGEEPFLAVNGDILIDLDLAAVYRGHRPEDLATLVLHDCPPYNVVWVDGEGLVRGIGARPGGVAGPPLAYTGVQVVSPGMPKYLPGAGPYDLVQAWREALAAGERLAALVVSGHFWQDLGTPAGYLAAHRRLLQGQGPGLACFFPEVVDPLLGPGAVLSEGVTCNAGVCLAAGVRVGPGAHLENTVAWERAWIGPGVSLENCIVGPHARVSRSAKGAILV